MRLLLVFIIFSLNECLFGNGTVRLATYNLRNYLSMDRHIEGLWRQDYPKPEHEKQIVRAIIKEVSADIIALQELGDISYLEELRSDLKLDGLDYPYLVHMKGEDNLRHIGILSKIKPFEVHKHTDLNFKYFKDRLFVRRGLLEVVFDQPFSVDKFRLFVVHLKSQLSSTKLDPRSELRRVREAEACRDRILERMSKSKEGAFIIAGDFNDHPGSSCFRRFESKGNTRISELLYSSDSRGELWTYFYKREAIYSTVDGFFISTILDALADVGDGHIVDSYSPMQGSDHRAVYVDINF